MAKRRDRPAQPRGGSPFEIRLGDGRTISLPQQQRRGPVTPESCCFCGEDVGEDSVEVTVRWLENGQERAQTWRAHRACLAERLHERVRGSGPFFA
jgi:hypothetical protein